jgi:S-DNA-T family DNA segregation ATPase FtsK/SpoIIIE
LAVGVAIAVPSTRLYGIGTVILVLSAIGLLEQRRRLKPVAAVAELEAVDPLRRVFVPPVRALAVDPGPVEALKAVQVGWLLDGRELVPFEMSVWGTPWLIGSSQGGGKSVLMWSIIWGIAPWVHSGEVELIVLDPKGGMELEAGRPLFSEFWCSEGENEDTFGIGAAALLSKTCGRLIKRTGRVRGTTRKVTPSVQEPLIVVLIDEIGSFGYQVHDSKVKAKIEKSIKFLTSQGRAPAVQVIAAVQDPRVETTPMRELFPNRVGLGMAHSGQPDLLFGQGSRDRGAVCDLIPEDQPGMGFVRVRGGRAFPRFKAFWQDDEAIVRLAQDYQPRRLRAVQ